MHFIAVQAQVTRMHSCHFQMPQRDNSPVAPIAQTAMTATRHIFYTDTSEVKTRKGEPDRGRFSL